jgi:adenylosuccinate synthase
MGSNEKLRFLLGILARRKPRLACIFCNLKDGAEELALCVPVYEEMPGWSDTTVGAKSLEELPAAARAYIKRVEELVGAPIDIISTGPDRNETIVLRHPFA